MKHLNPKESVTYQRLLWGFLWIILSRRAFFIVKMHTLNAMGLAPTTTPPPKKKANNTPTPKGG